MTYEMCKTLSTQNTEMKMPDTLIIHTNICNRLLPHVGQYMNMEAQLS